MPRPPPDLSARHVQTVFGGRWAVITGAADMSKRKRDAVETGPAYGGLCPRAGTRAGPQCSGSRDFCFLCEFSDTTAAASKSLVGEIKALASQLAKDGKELPVVVSAVARAYNEGVRQFVEWENPVTKKNVRAPAWTRDSIQRHLLYSNEFPLFDEGVNQIFHALIVAEQNVVMERSSGQVIPGAKTELLKTIAAYGKWIETRHRVKNFSGRT